MLPLYLFSLLQCNPLYSFMKFHEEFTVRCDLKESKEYLNQFNLQMDKVSYRIVGVVYVGVVTPNSVRSRGIQLKWVESSGWRRLLRHLPTA